ncbi:hypothetical protein DSL72_002444 [Monilinia vaccinii-corymbosi]|uniref:Uncharacterized protein n=1 Tax=Monilinia vaccinii-corymbosi TaxID=61207 RepID=A0A8A3PCN0_9HELO|nr:hypothetical protein DSL72_002444 [Monilinia vaccinii-corymbosi]
MPDKSIENDVKIRATLPMEVNEDDHQVWRAGLPDFPTGFSPASLSSLPPFPPDTAPFQIFQIATHQFEECRRLMDELEAKIAAFEKMVDAGFEKIDHWLELISRRKREKKAAEVELSRLLDLEEKLHDARRDMQHIRQCFHDQKDSISDLEHTQGLIVDLLISEGWVTGHWGGRPGGWVNDCWGGI